ncbi:ribbon-helix-helix protein, CopG family [Candidatus Daviesbacteria bacterium]|nr:ribbon-helix-helix protein, CopG family [Candidatus Daviesbacteria bacterium]
MQRTQIYLPEELRREIDQHRKACGESLTDYLRKAAKERLEKDKKRKTDLKKLADEFIGCSKRTDEEIQEWLDWVREERRLSDEVREERLQKALLRK